MSGSVETTGTRFIAPFVAAMSASGSAAFETVRQESVKIENIKYEFDYQLDDAAARSVLQSFEVSGKGPNSSIPFKVSLVNSSALGETLVTAITSATSATSKTVKTQLEADLNAGLKALIGSDGLINTLENDDLSGTSVTINARNGASNMVQGLTDARCNLIYTQIPDATLDGYDDASENQVTSALPLNKGDELTFVFNVSLSAVTASSTITNTGVGASATAQDGAIVSNVSGAYSATALVFTVPAARIAINLKLHTGGGVFADLGNAVEGAAFTEEA